jgi:hypothetical protein
MTARAASAVLVALPFAGCQATGVNPPAPTSADSPTPPASTPTPRQTGTTPAENPPTMPLVLAVHATRPVTDVSVAAAQKGSGIGRNALVSHRTIRRPHASTQHQGPQRGSRLACSPVKPQCAGHSARRCSERPGTRPDRRRAPSASRAAALPASYDLDTSSA